MNHLAKLGNRIRQEFGSTCWVNRRRKERVARSRGNYTRQPRLELLEDRMMLATTIYLDFGLGYWGGSLTTTENEIAYVAGYGPSNTVPGFPGQFLTTGPIPPVVPEGLVTLTPFSHNIDGVGAATIEDLEVLAAEVVQWMERTLEPFDVNVQLIEAAEAVDDMGDVAAYLDQQDANVNAYVFVQTIDVNGVPGENYGVGFGAAAATDLFLQVGNQYDEAALALPNVVANILTAAGLQVGTPEYNERLARGVASAILHESFHTFTFAHLVPDTALAKGDVMNIGNTGFDYFTVPSIVTRFGLSREPFIATHEPNGYLLAAEGFHSQNPAVDIDPIFGLRDDNQNGIPDLAYVTGTGAHDRITLSLVSPNVIHVTVEAFAYGIGQGSSVSESYTINMAGHSQPDTEGTILIDASRGDDLIIISSDIAASFRIRGGTGDDTLELGGNGDSALLSVDFQGEAGNDTLMINYNYAPGSDPLPLAGFEFKFDGGGGSDNTVVKEVGGVERVGYFVDTLADAADANLSDGRADSNSTLPDDQITLRAAIQEANLSANRTYIFLPAGTNYLSVSGTLGDLQGDLDITKNVVIVGAGPGLSVIDAGDLANHDRIFDVAGSGVLSVMRTTLALGAAPTTSGYRDGGAVRVQNDGEFNLDYSAVVGNETIRNGDGGAIYFASTGHGSITNSVITVNTADDETGGIYLQAASAPGAGGTVAVTRSVIVNNYDGDWSSTDVFAGTNREFTSGGYNRLGNEARGFVHDQNGDYIKQASTTVTYVVTSVVDSYDGTADPANLSLRDAISLANATAGTQEIWLPAWKFVLTQERITAKSLPEMNVSEGDIEITESLILRGIDGANGAATRVAWMAGTVADKVFELVGDYDNNIENGTDRVVDGDDFLLWQIIYGTSNLAADGNDDGVVNNDDLTILSLRLGNVLTVDGIQYT